MYFIDLVRLIVLFSVLASAAFAEQPPNPARPRIHIYGFGLFRGIFFNASGDIVRDHLPQALRDSCRENVEFTFEAPVETTRAAADRINERINERMMTIGLGVTSNLPPRAIRIETQANNCFRQLSGMLEQPPPECVVDEAERARHIRPLPPSVVAPLRVGTQSYPVGFGNATTCGDFVCNSTFYQGLQRNHDQHFIHIDNVQNGREEYAEAIAQVICRMVRARLRPGEHPFAEGRPHVAGANVTDAPPDPPKIPRH